MWPHHPRGCALPLALVLATLTSCAPHEAAREQEIAGQVFVVTAGRETIKLSLVPILVLRSSELRRHLAAKAARLDIQRAELDSKITNERAACDALLATYRRDEAGAGAAEQRYIASGSEDELPQSETKSPPPADSTSAAEWLRQARAAEVRRNSPDEIMAQNKASELRRSRQEATLRKLSVDQERLQSARARLAALTSARSSLEQDLGVFFEGLPPALAVSKSDADGKFTLRYSSVDSVVVVAQCDRRTLTSTESYFWMVGISKQGASNPQLMLSNDNMLSRGDGVPFIN